jgi:hypothetical protein
VIRVTEWYCGKLSWVSVAAIGSLRLDDVAPAVTDDELGH